MYDELVKKIRRCATDPMHCLSCDEDKDRRCFKRLMTQAADAIEELQKSVNFHKFNSEFWEDKYNSLADEKWRSAEDDPPPVAEKVIVATTFIKRDGKRLVDTDMLLSNGNWFEHSVTHWQPMPEPPEGE